MSHGSETRKMRGGDTGVKGRRSREGAGLGESLRATGPQGNLKSSARKAIKATEQMWNDVSHEWLGTNKSSFPYNMKKWDKTATGRGKSTLTNTTQRPYQTPLSRTDMGNRYNRKRMEREGVWTPEMKDDVKFEMQRYDAQKDWSKQAQGGKSKYPPPNYHPSGKRMTHGDAYEQEDWNQRKNRNAH